MINSKHLSGLSVVTIDDGIKVGQVVSTFLDASGKQLVAFGVGEKAGLLSSPTAPRAVLASDVRAIGPDVMTLPSASVLHDAFPPQAELDLNDLLNRKVVTEGGTFVGPIASVDFDERSRRLAAVEVSRGFFKSDRAISADLVVSIGQDVLIVADSVCATADDQRGSGATSDDTGHRLVVGDVQPTKPGSASATASS